MNGMRRLCVVGLLVMVCFACSGPRFWQPPTAKRGCDPTADKRLLDHPLYNKTFAGPDKRAFACLRFSWGETSTDAQTLRVRVDASGEISAWDQAKGVFVPDLQFSLPRAAEGNLRRFVLFIFADELQSNPGQQESQCSGPMKAPGYVCTNPKECWFSLAFVPSPSGHKGQAKSLPNTDDLCLITPSQPTLEAADLEPTLSEQPEPSEATEPREATDANEPLGPEVRREPEPTPEPAPEPGPEPLPEGACVAGNKRPCQASAPGACAKGTSTCSQQGRWGPCVAGKPTTELCNGRDDDCDGQTDEGFAIGLMCTRGEGECKRAGKQICTKDGKSVRCDQETSGSPTSEVCDGKDNDCDGLVDEGGGCPSPNSCSPPPCVKTLVGPADLQSGPSAHPWLIAPGGAVFDSAGNLYLVVSRRHMVLKRTPQGVVSKFAGDGVPGKTDGVGTAARFNFPHGVAIDDQDQLYVADQLNSLVRKIDAKTGAVTTLKTTGVKIEIPLGIACRNRATQAPELFLTSSRHSIVYHLDLVTNVVSLFAGKRNTPGFADGVGDKARFQGPYGIAVEQGGGVFIADSGNHVIRKISVGRVVTTFAGIGKSQGFRDGSAAQALFHFPNGVALHKGALYVADGSNGRIRKIVQGTVTTTAGSNTRGNTNGPALTATFSTPSSLAFDASGDLYVTDTSSNLLRKVSLSQAQPMVSTDLGRDTSQLVNASLNLSYLNNPNGLTFGSAGQLYVVDTNNYVIRKVDLRADKVTTFTGDGRSGKTTGSATMSRFRVPLDIVDAGPLGLLLSDTLDQRIRAIDAMGSTTRFAGDGTIGYLEGANAKFNRLTGLHFRKGSPSTLLVADTNNHCLRVIDLSTRLTRLFAGAQKAGTTGCVAGSTDGTVTTATFRSPTAVVSDAAGNIFVSDTGNHIIRKIDVMGNVTTLAGVQRTGNSSRYRDGAAATAYFTHPAGLAIGPKGALYVADRGNFSIRKIDLTTKTVSTVAGFCYKGSRCLSGFRDGAANESFFNSPSRLLFTSTGDLLIADSGNDRVRLLRLK